MAIIEHGRIIDIGTPEDLIRRHCPERSVVLSTDDPGAGSRFTGTPGLTDVRERDGRITLHGIGDDFVTQVIHRLSETGVRVTDFRTIMPNLEDVFLKVTGHSIRD